MSWSYWHAVCAPIHIAAVHYGASIEALQNSYIAHHGKNFKTSLIEKQEWWQFREESLKIVSNLNIDENEKRVLENKINSLNQTPQNIITERFLNSLGIKFSTLEHSAWQRRNNAAHGNQVESDDYISLIRELKILKIILHRVLLQIVDGSDYYLDYYSLGNPIRRIRECIPDEI